MTLPFHPYAELFPLIEGEAFEELVADIRDNGLREHIVVLDGQILDGRNRYRAGVAAGVIEPGVWRHEGGTCLPSFQVFVPRIHGDPLAFVLSKNLRRRHLDESQRALVAARISTLKPGRPPLPSSPTRGEGAPFSIDQFAAAADAVDQLRDAVFKNPDSVDETRDSVGAGAGVGEPGNSANLRGFSQADAAELLSVSERSVSSARVVVTDGMAELGKAVERGDIAVSAAAEIARLPVDEQRALIERMDPKAFAAVARAKRAERQAEKKARRERREAELGSRQRALPERRYGVIYADPEWRYEPWDRGSGMDRAADNHYPTSSTEEIKARPVADIAADDCVLFLWATVPMLREGLEVLAAWGFEYRSNLVWHKRRTGAARGPGYWFTNEHEILLLGVKGNPPCPAPGKQWASLIAADVREHSVKPDEFVWLIEDYFPTLPKIELNARVAREGWDAWGLEAPEPEQPERSEGVANGGEDPELRQSAVGSRQSGEGAGVAVVPGDGKRRKVRPAKKGSAHDYVVGKAQRDTRVDALAKDLRALTGDDLAALGEEYDRWIEAFDDAVRDGHEVAAAHADEVLEALRLAANGGERFASAVNERPVALMRRAAAPAGILPKWGQSGLVRVSCPGVAALVHVRGHQRSCCAELLACDFHLPFPSETGFRAETGFGPVLGSTVEQACTDLLRGAIARAGDEKKGLMRPDTIYAAAFGEDGDPVPVRRGVPVEAGVMPDGLEDAARVLFAEWDAEHHDRVVGGAKGKRRFPPGQRRVAVVAPDGSLTAAADYPVRGAYALRDMSGLRWVADGVRPGEPAAGLPTPQEDPDIPTFLRPGHPDCPVRA